MGAAQDNFHWTPYFRLITPVKIGFLNLKYHRFCDIFFLGFIHGYSVKDSENFLIFPIDAEVHNV